METDLDYQVVRDIAARHERLKDAAEMLWVVLANVSEGDWTKQTQEWQEAAARFRDQYVEALKPGWPGSHRIQPDGTCRS